MKAKTYLNGSLLVFIALLISYSCTQTVSELDKPEKIENTLKSVSYWNELDPVDPNDLWASCERLNAAIDSVGYPDAGYKLWQVKSDTALNFSYMVEGFWPDQNAYDVIHDHEVYKKATEEEGPLWEGLMNIQYNRFTRVK